MLAMIILAATVWANGASDRPSNRGRRTRAVTEPRNVEVVEEVEEIYVGKNEQEDRQIRIQAIALEVSNSALYESPLDLWDQDAHASQGKRLIQELARHKQGELAGGVVLVVANGDEGEVAHGDQEDEHIKIGGEEARHTTHTKTKIEFMASARIVFGGNIAVGFRYLQEVVRVDNNADADKEQESEAAKERQWQSQVSLVPGEPTIVGETIHSNKTTFLILSAQVL